MTTYAPATRFISLADRLAASELVVVGRAREMLEEWADPCGDTTQTFAVILVQIEEVLRGEAEDAIRVRVASQSNEDSSPAKRVASGNTVLLILSKDEDGDPPRYGLQHGSAFTVEGDVVDLPEDVPLGIPREDDKAFSLNSVRQILAQLGALDEERRKRYAEVDPEWEARDYPEVQEVADRQAKDERLAEAGPRGSQPVGELRAFDDGRPKRHRGPK